VTAENTADPAAPDTIVLIHGLWVTPRSWEHWIEHYENKGYRVLAPAYPGFEVEVEALNEDPSPIEALTIPAVVEHLESIVGELDRAPIIMGHSAGGLFTQILLDHGYGAAGVAIDSAPAEGVRVTRSHRSEFSSRSSRTRQTDTRRLGSPKSSSTTPSPTP
jgi:pimeloyl-ACP methyl ester carboxylesterase